MDRTGWGIRGPVVGRVGLERSVTMGPPRVSATFPGTVSMGAKVVAGRCRAIISYFSVGMGGGYVVRCCGLMDRSSSGGRGGGISPLSQAFGWYQGFHLRGRFVWAAFKQWIGTGLWGFPVSVAPLGFGEGLSGVLQRRVAEMGLMREIIVVCVWLVFGGGIGAMARCRVCWIYGGGGG